MSKTDQAATGGGAAEAGRRPGRPRSEESHRAILRATLELLVENGLGGLSMEAVAVRAGVAKTTIYRRYADKFELALDSLTQLRPSEAPPDTGSLVGDLRLLHEGQVKRFAGGRMARLPFQLIGEMDEDQVAEVRKRLVDPLRGVLATFLQRGVERGELRPDIDIETAVDAIHGAIVYRVLLSAGDVEWAGEVIEPLLRTLLEGIRPSSSSAGPGSARPRS